MSRLSLSAAAMCVLPLSGGATAGDFTCRADMTRFENVVTLTTNKLRGAHSNTGEPDECVALDGDKFLVTVNALPRVEQGIYFVDLTSNEVRQVEGFGLATIEKELPRKGNERRFLVRTNDARTGSSCMHLVVKLPPSYENVNFDWQRKKVKCGPNP